MAYYLHSQCPYCGLHHQRVCPLIRSIEYDQSGQVKRIEFHESRSYPHDGGHVLPEKPSCD